MHDADWVAYSAGKPQSLFAKLGKKSFEQSSSPGAETENQSQDQSQDQSQEEKKDIAS